VRDRASDHGVGWLSQRLCDHAKIAKNIAMAAVVPALKHRIEILYASLRQLLRDNNFDKAIKNGSCVLAAAAAAVAVAVARMSDRPGPPITRADCSQAPRG